MCVDVGIWGRVADRLAKGEINMVAGQGLG